MNRFLSLTNRDKPRLYMAMFARGVNGTNDVKFHTALLLSPKNPDAVNRETIRYHVKNVLVGGVITWVFSTEQVRNRTEKLLSTALLGKISIPEAELRAILETVPVVQDNSEWRCCHWVWNAIQVCRQSI